MDSFAGLSVEERRLVVGIDFGTTYSGLAWAETRRSDHQSVVESWPVSRGTHEGFSCVKVPTEIRYATDGVEWGFQIPPAVARHKWFKLGLEKGTISSADGHLKTPEDLSTDYLTALVGHLMYTLEQNLGAAILRTTPVEFCLTVPAIWSEVAKEKTLQACQKACLKSEKEILFVSEPEAAAIYTLHGLDRHGLNIGDTFVLCDAGGGTVDLISYTVTELHPILKVREAASGTGERCGSTFLNRRFCEFLTSKLGDQPGWDSEILAEAMEKFESLIKRHYSPSTLNKEGYSILVPGIPNNDTLGIRRGRYIMTPAEMDGIFEPVVRKIIKLVEAQILSTSRQITAVLLVGGFGQNNYLKERLRASLGSGILVLQPPNAWTAVVRGAVMLGLARANSKLAGVGLVSRAARKHYGVNIRVDFEEDIHDDAGKFWSEKRRKYKIMAMEWFIKKNDPVTESQPSVIYVQKEFLLSDGAPASLEISILCDEQTVAAPIHRTSNVRTLVTLGADLRQLPKLDLEKTIVTREDGNQYFSIDCAIEATFYSASTKYVLLCQGKRYDTVTAEYA